jgi:hypothetical protein
VARKPPPRRRRTTSNPSFLAFPDCLRWPQQVAAGGFFSR